MRVGSRTPKGVEEAEKNCIMYFVTEMEQRGGNHFERGWELGVKGTEIRTIGCLSLFPIPLSLLTKTENKWHSW